MRKLGSAPLGSTGEWQSFSFRQLVSLLAILVLGVVLLPTGVQAVGQLMSIVDEDSDADLAQVDAGSLRVGDGSGALTVDGTVQADLPLGTSSLANGIPSNSRARITGPIAAGGRFAIGSLTLYGASTTASVVLEVRHTVSGNCSSSGTLLIARAVASIVPGQTLHLPYPLPLTFGTSSSSWCLYGRSIGGSFTLVHVGRTVQ
jgi:hypothetical protein